MQRATHLFSPQQRQQIADAVTAAESQTSCEIVPVVATQSGRYDRAEDMVGLWLAVIAAITVWLVFPRTANEHGDWSGLSFDLGLVLLVVSIVAAFLIGALAGSQIGWLRRLFTPRQQMQEEVNARARAIFFDQRIHHTSGATGLLIYVSLYEHQAVVLGDQEILDKVGQSVLDQLCAQLTTALKQSSPTEALQTVITEAGKHLSGPLPRAADDVNELADALVLLD
ncbi:hypothetical protein [Blastopirellula marina]|uniref:TPM domain-containing protein n=1 Tax=Blastopirellula marina TaxID=124 RepID=A0A2S8F965_9BACT|nr:hypothetical protein [Blastopirellula marina]PQO28706.1 hypothetical protein C5Y98_23265 [Blastopirellula marina]PTL41979.1 hypothetical protein C5Y97_23275 [Blastopirellula marina]